MYVQTSASPAKVPQMYISGDVMYIRELSDSDETFFLGRRRAGTLVPCTAAFCVSGQINHGASWHRCDTCHGTGKVRCRVVIITMRGTHEIPIMEFSTTGQFSEVPAPRLHSTLAQRLMHHTAYPEDYKSMSKRRQRGLHVTLSLLSQYEQQGGRV